MHAHPVRIMRRCRSCSADDRSPVGGARAANRRPAPTMTSRRTIKRAQTTPWIAGHRVPVETEITDFGRTPQPDIVVPATARPSTLDGVLPSPAPLTVGMRSSASDPVGFRRAREDTDHGLGRGSKLLVDLYEEVYPLPGASPLPQVLVCPTRNTRDEGRVKVGACHRVQSDQSLVKPYAGERSLSSNRQNNHRTSHGGAIKPAARRSRSSVSRLSRLSQRSGVRESSDGMDNTDLSSETDHDKDADRPKPPSLTAPPCHIDADTLDKVERWMKHLPRKFSGLCTVISIPDASPGYGD